MNNLSSPTCSRCGAAMPAGATDQACPACLMSGALAAPGDAVALASTPPKPGCEPAAFPREFGGYRLLGVLGTGGMATVYEAEQLATGRRVALKLLEQRLDSPEMRHRFLREGRLAASVNHPNSLYIFGSEEIDNIPVITMEIAAGGTLRDQLKRRGPFEVPAAVDAILDVIAGLQAANAGGVLHRDVKPSNCFVEPNGAVKVGDFGLSVSMLASDDSYATATGVIMGTPAYASPEQLRGDDLDVRADIYSVGATLYTLLTGAAPFEGRNAVQVVANAVNQPPKPLRELREGLPPELEQVIARCLKKEPEGRYRDYMELRNALLPFGSREAQPASLRVRAAAGWVDYLIAFMIPYVPLMLAAGGEEFHVRPILEPTLYSARYYLACFGFAILYFTIAEGIWGAGFGKQLKGLRVVGKNGQPAGIGRALIRTLIPLLCCEGVRIPLLLAAIPVSEIHDMTTSHVVLFFVASFACPWLPALLTWRARRDNGYATGWDLISGTRVVVKPKGAVRPALDPAAPRQPAVADQPEQIGPYQLVEQLLAGKWIVATDPVLRRQVWLLRRTGPKLPLARRNLARLGRLRWLQTVTTADGDWDAFEATAGVPFASRIEGGKRVPWQTLRHWLHDLASELLDATGEQSLPAELSLDHVWITTHGHAVLLDEPWPVVQEPAGGIRVSDLVGQQRFLHAVAAAVDPTSVPLHARRVLQNLEAAKFERLSFLTGTLRGLLDKPAEVSPGIRAASIFLLPLYVWALVFVGSYHGADWLYEIIGNSAARIAVTTAVVVLAASALVQLLELPLRTTTSHATFRLAVVNENGELAAVSSLLRRWAIAWLPLFVPIALVALGIGPQQRGALIAVVVLLLLWLGAAVHAALHPKRGLHDRLAGTLVVRR